MINPVKFSIPKTHHQDVNQVLWQILGLNLLVAAAKVGVGWFTGSISMLADGFHSMMDGSSNIVGLVGSTIAARPPDADHPYGHEKYETFATLTIGLLLLLTSWQVLKSIINRLWYAEVTEVTTMSFAVMIATIIINFLVTRYEAQRGHELDSHLLLADAEHTRSDLYVSGSVILSLIAVSFGFVWIDTLMALFIVIIIARAGLDIIRRASETLADSAIIDPTDVERIVLSVDGVKSCHKIRSRGTNQCRHLDLHIQVDGSMSLAEAHYLGHVTQGKLQDELRVTDVLVHVEPVA